MLYCLTDDLYKVALHCTVDGCADVNFTSSIIIDVHLAGIHNSEIRREILGDPRMKQVTVREIVAIVARDVMGLNRLQVQREASDQAIHFANAAAPSCKRQPSMQNEVTMQPAPPEPTSPAEAPTISPASPRSENRSPRSLEEARTPLQRSSRISKPKTQYSPSRH